ncbi:hypothetical protein ONE63_001045 [Megalurothrips usitatus]|uniref:Uncharacterized protein n=1 Tax=Megalurothrips usitatus TaxID=439358 RepID=A0AAV7XHP7_9NEOP|nr:hypothetical protein ONE63_001045 [Megalurothrips usitatus]
MQLAVFLLLLGISSGMAAIFVSPEICAAVEQNCKTQCEPTRKNFQYDTCMSGCPRVGCVKKSSTS